MLKKQKKKTKKWSKNVCSFEMNENCWESNWFESLVINSIICLWCSSLFAIDSCCFKGILVTNESIGNLRNCWKEKLPKLLRKCFKVACISRSFPRTLNHQTTNLFSPPFNSPYPDNKISFPCEMFNYPTALNDIKPNSQNVHVHNQTDPSCNLLMK